MRIRSAWLAVPALAASVFVQGQPQTAAHILDIQGIWHLVGSTTVLTAGYALSSGARIEAAAPFVGSFLTVVRDADLARTRIACDTTATDPCRQPIAVTAPSESPAGQSQFKIAVQAAFAVLLGRPPALGSGYALTLSRGLEPDRESEAIVVLDHEGNFTLPAPIPALAPGIYSVSIAPAAASAPPTDQSASLGREGNWTPLHLKRPAAYRLTIADAEGHRLRDIVVLAVPSADFDSERVRLDRMRSLTATWQGPHARTDEHIFLRTFLIAEGQPKVDRTAIWKEP